jgi:hypothetical protein
MLRITIPGTDSFDDHTEKFVTVGDITLELEHSLVSLSKWESTWEKPFLGKDAKTDEETLGYVVAMSSDPDISPETLSRLSTDNIKQINDYIDAKMTATWFNDAPSKARAQETITAELVYYWMITLGIPLECQHWHLNRLFTLIKVFNKKNAPAKKMSKADLAERNRQLNEQRKARFNTKG